MREDAIIKVSRTSETYTQESSSEKFSTRYAYARSAESRIEDEPGQDYLLFSNQSNFFSFALCDGVSQSFFGDLASQILGDGLIQWLNEQNSNLGQKQLAVSLSSYLEALTETGSHIVETHQIEKNLPEMLVSVLEEKRTLGSESMYLCGRIDLEGVEFPQGRLLLSWMGDGRIRLWNKKKELTKKLEMKQDTGTRWSTRKGIVGHEPGIFLGPMYSRRKKTLYQKILAYTDGFALLDKAEKDLSNQDIDKLIDLSLSLPENDDLSMLELSIP